VEKAVRLSVRLSRGFYSPPLQRPWCFPPRWPDGSPNFFIIMHFKAVLTEYMTFLSFDNHFETKVLFLMHFGSQIINEYYDDTNNGRMAD